LYRNAVVSFGNLGKFSSTLQTRDRGLLLKRLLVTEVPVLDDLRITQKCIDHIYCTIVGTSIGTPESPPPSLAPNVTLIMVLSGALSHSLAAQLRKEQHSNLPFLSFGTRSSIEKGMFRIQPMKLGKLLGPSYWIPLSRRNSLLGTLKLVCFVVSFGLAVLGLTWATGILLSEDPIEQADFGSMVLAFMGSGVGMACHRKISELHEPVTRSLEELWGP
jgi:hypothetical protein